MTLIEAIVAEIRDWKSSVGEVEDQDFYRLHGALDALKFLADRFHDEKIIDVDELETVWEEAYKR
jgi:hypothetical protein